MDEANVRARLEGLTHGIAEVERSIQATTNEKTKQRLQTVLNERIIEKRELESKMSGFEAEARKAAEESATDIGLLHSHLRRSAMSDREKSSFISRHGMKAYVALKL